MRISAAILTLSFCCLRLASQTTGSDVLKQTTFEGTPAVTISNEVIELTMLPKGGNFVSLTLREDKAGMNPLWNPAGIARTAGKPTRGAGGGHFVCVDGFGTPSPEERKAGMPGHGEAHQQPWQVRSSAKTNGIASVTFTALLPLMQENFQRTIQLVDGESVIYVESELENLMSFDRPVNWAEHATIGSPFLAPGKTVVDLSAKQSKTRGHNDEEDPYPHRLADFRDFDWPLAPGVDGSVIDVRNAPAKFNSLDHTTSLMDPSRTLEFATALNLEHKLLLGYVFRRTEYPWLQIWESYPPDMGAARGLEFGTQPFDISHREVLERGPLFGAPVVRWLPAKSKIGSRFLFFYTKVPDGFTRVDDVVLQDGKLTIQDRSARKTFSLAASLGL